tara:strand:- start:8 stop:280 length:273 start_codon:yes stop_codon:yes gene_type:complete
MLFSDGMIHSDLIVLSSLDDSFVPSDTIAMFGSFYLHGTFFPADSFDPYGTVNRIGSFTNSVTFVAHGSFNARDTFNPYGSFSNKKKGGI